MAKGKAEARPTTKSESMAFIAEKTGLTRKQVAGVFEALTQAFEHGFESVLLDEVKQLFFTFERILRNCMLISNHFK